MLTKRYMPSTKNVPAILDKIVDGTAPGKFTTSHLKTIGFPSSNDRAIIPLLKDLGFLSADGTPTKRYHEYRNEGRSKAVLGEALREAYEDVFHINARPTKADRAAIQGTFKSVNNVSELEHSTADRGSLRSLRRLNRALDGQRSTDASNRLYSGYEDSGFGPRRRVRRG